MVAETGATVTAGSERVSAEAEKTAPWAPREDAISDEHAYSTVAGGGHVSVDRHKRRTTLTLPVIPEPSILVHPLVSFTAVVVARWRRMQAFHAGAFVVDGEAWGVLGDRGAGKSSLLAALNRIGYPVLADDVVVVDQARCLAGPRAVDLRPEAARQFPEAQPRGVVGARERWRVSLGPVPPYTPLRGWLSLQWGDAAARVLPPQQRIQALSENLAVRLPPPDPSAFLKLAGLPVIQISRARDLSRVVESATDVVRATRRLTV